MTPPHFNQSQASNLRSALSLSLLLLPPKFTEYQLWEQIAGISYSGDPRMSVPGAENPEKVKNIVRGEGVREGLRGMYGHLMEEIGSLRWDEGRSGEKEDTVAPGQRQMEWVWRGDGSDHLIVS